MHDRNDLFDVRIWGAYTQKKCCHVSTEIGASISPTVGPVATLAS